MPIHPSLVLMPIFGFLVLPCESSHANNSLWTVANVTVSKPEECGTFLCSPADSCTKTFYDQKKLICYLISCPRNESICENAEEIEDLLAKQDSRTGEESPPYQSSEHKASEPSQDEISPNHTQPLKPTLNISSTSIPINPPSLPNVSTTTVSITLQTNPSNQSAGSENVPGGVFPTIIPTAPSNTSSATTTPTAAVTTTKPSTTSTSTTIAQNSVPQQPSSPSPSRTKTSPSTSPSVPTTPPPIPSPKPVQPSPAPTSTKPSTTTTKTSTHPSVLPSTLTVDNMDQSRTDQTKVEVAGDPLTIHLLNTSSLMAVLIFGLLFFVVAVALFLKQAYESYRRKDYTQVDYLINGMYSDSGV